MSNFIDFLRRSFVVVVTCVITVVSMAVAISPSVSAAGVFSPFNFYQLYQMLHGLLLGDGGGNSQTFGEWLEENMTRTVGSGNEKKEFLITPGMKLSDMMTQASLNLVLGAALSDGGIAGTSKIKDLIDSWNEVYDTSDIGEIGDSAGSDSHFSGFSRVSLDGYSCILPGWSNLIDDYEVSSSSGCRLKFSAPKSNASRFSEMTPFFLYCDSGFYLCYYAPFDLSPYRSMVYSYPKFWYSRYNQPDSMSGISLGSSFSCISSSSSLSSFFAYHAILYSSSVDYINYILSALSDNGISITSYPGSIDDYFNLFSLDNYPISDDFIGPVYAMPAAKQLITDTGTLSGLRLDIQSEDGTPDISAALDHAGVDNVNDLVAGVAAGTIPMSQVYDDMRVVPYVLTDVDTGEIVTDLNVSATDAKTKAVALDKDLSIPKDISAADAYQITGKTWDPSLSKYKLPLFDFFPFCLPYDAYQFLTMLDVTPVAPVFQVDTTPLFSHTRFFHAADGYKITLDLTKYEEVFQILRAGECLAIVVGLCLISYKLIHGGD